MDKPTIINKEAEIATIGACLADPNAIIFVASETRPEDFAVPANRWLADAIWWCLDQRIPPTMAAVIDRLSASGRWSDNGKREAVAMADIDAALRSISETDIEYAPQNARLVHDAAFRRNGKASLERASKLFDNADLPADDIHKGVLRTIGEVFDGRQRRDAALVSVMDEEHQRLAKMGENDLPGVTCGIKWLDEVTGGFLPAESWVIAAPYKMRKTTVALNMIMAAARAGAPVSVMTVGDSSRDATYRKMLAMVMNEIMISDGAGPDRQVVSSKTLQFILKDKYYSELKSRAELHLYSLPIRLYDGRDMIADLGETARLIRRDVAMHGTRIFVYDYAQACAHGLKDYERTTYFAGWTQQITGEVGFDGHRHLAIE